MIFQRLFILFISALFFSAGARAQDTGFVYRDTSIVALDSVETNTVDIGAKDETIVDDKYEESDDEVIYVDTTLQWNNLLISPDSVRALKRQKAFAYARNLDSLLNAYQQEQKQKDAPAKDEPSLLEKFFLSNLTRYFFYTLAVLFILFILYKLFFAEGFFQRAYARSTVKIIEDESEHLSHDTDYTKLITQAIGQKNYRLAIRYYYLQSLQKLSSKGLIEFSPDKTNYEYVQELSGKKYKQEFAALTLNYEYAWYGEFDISEAVFESVQQKFKQFNGVLS